MKSKMKSATSIIAILLSMVLSIVAILISCDFGKHGEVGANVRTVSLASAATGTEYLFEGFENVERREEDNVFTYTATKRIKCGNSSDIDEISESEKAFEYADIEYVVDCDANTGRIALTAYLSEGNEQIADTLYGTMYYDNDGNVDVRFVVDGEIFSAREMLNSSAIEECSFWGNLLHLAINKALIFVAAFEPAIVLTLAASYDFAKLLIKVGYTIYRMNYDDNSRMDQPSGFVTNQNEYSEWKFGLMNLKHSGCEVIAGYNMAKAKGIDITLAKTTFLYEALGIEIGCAGGYFGSNPYQIGYFLTSIGIKYIAVYSHWAFNTLANNSNQYHMIVSRWNDTTVGSQIHTYYVDKLGKSNFVTYNMNAYYKAQNKDSADALFGESPSKTFMVAYFVAK